MEPASIKKRLSELAKKQGTRMFGVCKVEELRDGFHPEIREISKKLNTALSFGIALSRPVLETLLNHPNMIYKAHYQQVNHSLNDLAFAGESLLREKGYEALTVPASQIVDWNNYRAHLSHREVAHKAGLGWRGRNNLLVAPGCGSAVRLVTVLTDADLPSDKPLAETCGDCVECLPVCPAGAIAFDPEDFDLEACRAKVVEFSKKNNYGHLICGLCLKVCRGGN